MIKELDDIIQHTPPGELRTDLEFTRDKLIFSLYEEHDEEKKEEKGRREKRRKNKEEGGGVGGD